MKNPTITSRAGPPLREISTAFEAFQPSWSTLTTADPRGNRLIWFTPRRGGPARDLSPGGLLYCCTAAVLLYCCTVLYCCTAVQQPLTYAWGLYCCTSTANLLYCCCTCCTAVLLYCVVMRHLWATLRGHKATYIPLLCLGDVYQWL